MIIFTFVFFALVAPPAPQTNPAAGDPQRLKAQQAYDRYYECVEKKDHQKALSALDEIPEAFQIEYKAHFFRGHALLQLKRYDEALAEFAASERSLEEVPPHLLYWVRAQCRLGSHDPPRGLRELVKCMSAAPIGIDDAHGAALVLQQHTGSCRKAIDWLQEVRAEEFAAPHHWLWQGVLAYYDKDYGAAEANLSRFLGRLPDHLRGLYWRCKTRLKLRNDAGAVSDYREILKGDPELAGGFDEEAATLKLVGGGPLPYGRRQVEAVLRDRPRMANHFDPENPLHYWAALRFEVKAMDLPIRWERSPHYHSDADAYNIPAKDHRGWLVNLSDTYRTGTMKGKERSVDELWCSLVFELENVTGRVATQALRDRARAGDISEHDYIEGIVRSEYQAELRTRAFFVLIYYPWCVRKGLDSAVADWDLADTLTLDDLLFNYRPDDPSEWQTYRAQHKSLRESGPLPEK